MNARPNHHYRVTYMVRFREHETPVWTQTVEVFAPSRDEAAEAGHMKIADEITILYLVAIEGRLD